MGMGALVDAGLGVLAVMVLFSLVATAMQESVAQIFNTRGRMLRDGVKALLEAEEGKPTFENFYDKARLTGLTPPDAGSYIGRSLRWITLKLQRLEKPLPSGIPPRRYALAMLELASPEGRDGAAKKALAVVDAGERMVADALSEITEDPQLQAAAAARAERGRALIAQAQAAAERALARHEAEFNAAMDRVGGWYARRARSTLFAIGLILAAGANIDILNYAERLLTEESFRSRAAAHAELLNQRVATGAPPLADGAAQLGLGDIEDLAAELQALGVIVGWCEKPAPPAAPSPAIAAAQGAAPGFVAGLICAPEAVLRPPRGAAVIGWVLIAFGVTMGAQFWYDLFKKLLDMRASGRVSGDAA